MRTTRIYHGVHLWMLVALALANIRQAGIPAFQAWQRFEQLVVEGFGSCNVTMDLLSKVVCCLADDEGSSGSRSTDLQRRLPLSAMQLSSMRVIRGMNFVSKMMSINSINLP